ncbi:MAG: hypothetical protein JWM16_3413 [Verrucomicrobiales bacterium]|nr:hypothetical protein [Verrucomicrobiales bacterium]
MAEGVGNAPTSVETDFAFKTGAASLYLLAFRKWLPGLDSHQDKRVNRPPCYFDTTWQWCCRQELHLHRFV